KAVPKRKSASKAKKFRAAAVKRRAKLAPRKKSAKKAAPARAQKLKTDPRIARKVAEQAKKAEALLSRGRERGFVTYDAILKSCPIIETDVLFLEELYERFSTAGIDVLEGGGML